MVRALQSSRPGSAAWEKRAGSQGAGQIPPQTGVQGSSRGLLSELRPLLHWGGASSVITVTSAGDSNQRQLLT